MKPTFSEPLTTTEVTTLITTDLTTTTSSAVQPTFSKPLTTTEVTTLTTDEMTTTQSLGVGDKLCRRNMLVSKKRSLLNLRSSQAGLINYHIEIDVFIV